MTAAEKGVEIYRKLVAFPEVSGFEILELLDVRSKLAEAESDLAPEYKAMLEEADWVFLRNAPAFLRSLSKIGSLDDLRRQASAPCSHWWWYLDRLSQQELIRA